MKKLINLIIGICGFFISGEMFAQDIHFDQYLQAPLLVNPASTGIFEGGHRIISNYKSQWGAMSSPYKTMAFSYDSHLLKDKLLKGNYLGVGFFAFQDVAGDSKLGQTQVNGSLSGIVQLDKSNSISVGLQGGYSQRSVTTDNLRWGNQYDEIGYNSAISSNETISYSSFGYFDLSTGIFWQYRDDRKTFNEGNKFSKFDFGVSYNHVNKPRQKFIGLSEKLHTKVIIHGSGEFDLKNPKFAVVASCYYIRQGKLHEFVIGGSMKYYISKRLSKYTGFGKQSAISFGAQMRIKDAFIPTLMYENEGFSLGLAYDFNISSLNQVSTNGGYEIVLRYTIGNR